jgi:hypothetical protein
VRHHEKSLIKRRLRRKISLNPMLPQCSKLEDSLQNCKKLISKRRKMMLRKIKRGDKNQMITLR